MFETVDLRTKSFHWRWSFGSPRLSGDERLNAFRNLNGAAATVLQAAIEPAVSNGSARHSRGSDSSALGVAFNQTDQFGMGHGKPM